MTTALQALDVDVQLMILEVLSQISSKSLLNVALSSRSLYHLSRPFIYRIISFTFNRRSRGINRRLIKQLLADDHLSAKVRDTHILWALSAKLQPGEGSKEVLELLGQAIPKLNGLKAFIWDAQYSILSWLLRTLQLHHPQCLLYIRHPASQDSAQTLPRLCGSPCLFALDVTITNGQFQAFRELRKVLFSAPNMRDLTIASTFDSAQLISYQQSEDIEPLRLRSLELYGRVFDTFKLPIAWPMLERLSLDRIPFSPIVLPELSRLKSLRLRSANFGSVNFLSQILQGCNKLEDLDVNGSIASVVGEDFWNGVGKTLLKLRLHEERASNNLGAGAVLSPSNMGCIAKHCRNLRSLGLDLQCNGQEWPHSMLHYIADEFWFLVHLELNILIESPQHSHPTSPKATLDSVPEVWRYLWQQILSSRARRGHSVIKPRLRSLDLTAGSLRSIPDTSLPDWQVDQQRFTFDLSDRDDEARLGIVNVKCTELEALLSKLSSSRSLWNHQQELIMNIATERARKGPHIEMPSVMEEEMIRPSPFWDKLDKERFSYR